MLAQVEKYILKHSQNKQEIRRILGASLEKLSVADGIEVLRLLLGRNNFDYEMVGVLKQRGCDLNKPLGDVYANPDGYTTTDYLASYGRLSPRLISEMAKAGYDFKRLNNRGEHAGFYLVGGAPLNKEVVAALKAQGVDFSIKNKDGKTVAETAVEGLITYAKTVGSHPRVMFKNRLGAFFERRDDFVDLYYADKDKIVEDLNRWLAEIEPEINADKGIQSVYDDYSVRVDRCQRVYDYCKKHNLKDYLAAKTAQPSYQDQLREEFLRGTHTFDALLEKEENATKIKADDPICLVVATQSVSSVLQCQVFDERQRKK